MKINITATSSTVKVNVRKLFLGLVFLIFVGAAFGQSSAESQNFGDLASIKWQISTDLNASLVQEQAKMAQALSVPTIQEDERAIFKSYQRLLTYIQSDLQAGKPVNEAITASYEKVVTEAPNDPELKSMPDGYLATFVPGLIEALAEVQKPATSN